MISIKLKGRMGNHLFQYAVGRTVAEREGLEFCFPSRFLGEVILGFDCELGVYKEQPVILQEKVGLGAPQLDNVKDGMHLEGFWQNEKYFKQNQEAVRKWFYMSPSPEPLDYCAIHLRNYALGSWKTRTLPVEYFVEAKEFLFNVYGVTKFVIVTDDQTLAEKYFPDDDIVASDEKTDFKHIKDAKYKIISNSSFSWWAAWLGLPESSAVVAPAKWLNYNLNKKREKENKAKPRWWPLVHTKDFIWI